MDDDPLGSVGVGKVGLVKQETVDVVTVTRAKVLVTLCCVSGGEIACQILLHIQWIDDLGCC